MPQLPNEPVPEKRGRFQESARRAHVHEHRVLRFIFVIHGRRSYLH